MPIPGNTESPQSKRPDRRSRRRRRRRRKDTHSDGGGGERAMLQGSVMSDGGGVWPYSPLLPPPTFMSLIYPHLPLGAYSKGMCLDQHG